MTSSKSCGSSSIHTSVSADRTALLARAWANMLPFLLTCKKLQVNREDKSLISSIIWPYSVCTGLAPTIAWITCKESPSITTWWRLSSWAKRMALHAAKASTTSAFPGSLTLWLKAAMTSPSESLTTTPRPAHLCSWKRAPSKFSL